METVDILRTSLGVLGYTGETIFLGRKNKAFLRLSHPDHAGMMTMSAESPLYPFTTASARLICKDKSNAYDFAKQCGLAVPESLYVEKDDPSYDAAFELLRRHVRLIVKPLDASLSNGLTLNITSKKELESAIDRAREFSDCVIVQQQVIGEEVRFAVIDGKVRAAILRQTPSVIGDGVSTLQELINKENEARMRVTETFVPYPLLDDTIINLSAVTLSTIYKKGERIELGKSTMIRGGASMFNVISTVHPDYITLVERLCRPLGMGFVVADIMIVDYRLPATTKNYSFIEFNLSPAIKLFYSCRDGKNFKVVETFLAPMIDRVLRRGESS